MKKWKVVYKNSSGYIEMSPIFYPKDRIRKKKIEKQKRKRYTTMDKMLFLQRLKVEYDDNVKKAAKHFEISYKTALKWTLAAKKEQGHFMNKLKQDI